MSKKQKAAQEALSQLSKKVAKKEEPVAANSPQDMISFLKDHHAETGETMEPHDFYVHSGFSEWQVRKHFGGYANFLKKAGLGAIKEKEEAADKGTEDKEFESASHKEIFLKAKKLKAENEKLRDHVSNLEIEAVSSTVLKELIYGVQAAGPMGDVSWLTPKTWSKTKGTPCLFISDVHFDEVVDPAQINGMNQYNRKIACKRLQHTFNQTISLLRHEIKDPQYDGIVLALGGDMLSGNIHEELAETNDAQILESCIALIDQLIAGITLLHKEFGRVYVPCVVGNHGRLHKKPRAKNRVFDNYEWLVYSFLARHFKDNDKITFDIPDGPDCLFQIYNKRICLTHGDQFKGGSGISGIFTPLMLGMARKQKKYGPVGKNFDFMMLGHFHQLIQTQQLLVNGSVKGYDEWVSLMNFGFEPPQQSLFITHPQFGITHQMPVLCDPDFNIPSNSKSIW